MSYQDFFSYPQGAGGHSIFSKKRIFIKIKVMIASLYTNSRLRATAFQTQAYPENKWFNPEPNRFKIRLQ